MYVPNILSVGPLAPHHSKKIHLTVAPRLCSAALPRQPRLPLHHASAPLAGISTAPERGFPSSSLSTTPLAHHGLLGCVDPLWPSPRDLPRPCPLEQQGDIALKTHVASVCFKCFRCFRGMLQVFHADVAKVDRVVAHVAMGNTRMFQVYVPNVSFVLNICYKCFISTLEN